MSQSCSFSRRCTKFMIQKCKNANAPFNEFRCFFWVHGTFCLSFDSRWNNRKEYLKVKLWWKECSDVDFQLEGLMSVEFVHFFEKTLVHKFKHSLKIANLNNDDLKRFCIYFLLMNKVDFNSTTAARKSIHFNQLWMLVNTHIHHLPEKLPPLAKYSGRFAFAVVDCWLTQRRYQQQMAQGTLPHYLTCSNALSQSGTLQRNQKKQEN